MSHPAVFVVVTTPLVDRAVDTVPTLWRRSRDNADQQFDMIAATHPNDRVRMFKMPTPAGASPDALDDIAASPETGDSRTIHHLVYGFDLTRKWDELRPVRDTHPARA